MLLLCIANLPIEGVTTKMPKISQGKTGGVITYDANDWLGGVVQTSTAGSNETIRFIGDGMAAGTRIDPLRQYGFLQPGFVSEPAVEEGGVDQYTFNGYLRNGVTGATASGTIRVFAISTGGTVYRINADTGTSPPAVSTTSPFPHTIDHSHTAEVGEDCVNYYTGTTSRMFYSFYDNTDWDIGIYNYAANTFDDDFMSTVAANPLASPYLAGGALTPKPLVVGDDDVLYVGDRNFLHAYDGQLGANGTFFPAVLTLPQGFIIKSFAKTSDKKLVIFGFYSPVPGATTADFAQDATAFFWDYLSLDPTYVRSLNDNYAGEAFNWSGTVACFTSGRSSDAERGLNRLQVFNGTEFEEVMSYVDGSAPEKGGVQVVGQDIMWNAGGKLMTFGDLPSIGKYAFHHLTGSSSQSLGLCKTFRSDDFAVFVSNGTSTAGFEMFRRNYIGSGSSMTGLRAQPELPERKIGRVTAVEITYAQPFSGGRSVKLELTYIATSSVTKEVMAATTSSTQNKVRFEEFSDGAEIGNARFTSIQPTITYATGAGATAAAAILKIDIFYDIIDIKI